MTSAHPVDSATKAAARAAIQRLAAAFLKRALEAVEGGEAAEVKAVAVIEPGGAVAQRSHIEGPREFPLRRKA